MMDDRRHDKQTPEDIRRSARQLVDRHGDGAEELALKRAIQMEEIGHKGGAANWGRIRRAVRQCLAQRGALS